jgi:hypothetical protein
MFSRNKCHFLSKQFSLVDERTALHFQIVKVEFLVHALFWKNKSIIDNCFDISKKKAECIQIFDSKDWRKEPLERPSSRWKKYIKMYLNETGWEIMHWIHLAQDRKRWSSLGSTVTNCSFPQEGNTFSTAKRLSASQELCFPQQYCWLLHRHVRAERSECPCNSAGSFYFFFKKRTSCKL